MILSPPRRLAGMSKARRPLMRSMRPTLEFCERRELLAANFLQGVAYLDNNANNTFDAGDAPRVAASIQLRDFATDVLAATTATNGEGYYRFDSVPAGHYKIYQVPDATSLATNGQVPAIFNSGSWAGSYIDATVTNVATAKIDRVPGIAGGLAGVPTAYTLSTTTPAFRRRRPTPSRPTPR